MNRPLLVLFLAAAFGASVPVAARQQSRTIYVSVVDSEGVPVPGIRVADVAVTEDGQPRRVLSMTRSAAPLKLAVLVDEHGLWTGPMRESVMSLAALLRGQTEIGVFTSARPEWTIVDFTRDPKVFLDAIRASAPSTARPGRPIAVEPLVQELARQFRREHIGRPVILALSLSRGLPLSPNWELVVREVQRSRTSVFAVGANGIDPLIDAAVEASGGRADVVVTDTGFPSAVNLIQDDILGQYALEYAAPHAPPDGFRVRVSVNRPGVKVRAPERVY